MNNCGSLSERWHTVVALLLVGLILLSGCNWAAASESAPVALETTQWALASYANSEGKIVSVLLGTKITAGFTADQVSGSGGCNSYSAPYQVEGDVMTVGPVIATLMACAEPDGIMEQEYDFTVALQSATAYQVDGDTLTLMDANGASIATFAQAQE
jgi:heat shock protein HslJ